MPELRALFTIPPRATALHNLLQTQAVNAVVTALHLTGGLSLQSLRTSLDGLVQQGRLPRESADEILAHPWAEIEQAIRDVQTAPANTFPDLLREEHHALLDASLHGYPPVLAPQPNAQVLFQVDPHGVQHAHGPRGHRLRVTPIPRLRTVTVQVQYRREVAGGIAAAATPVDIAIADAQGQHWYPGIEFLGEGLFLSLEEGHGWHFDLAGAAAETWASQSVVATYPPTLFRVGGTPDELHPVFVWWHTLAHLLIRAISVDAGYSSSSIRERVYLEVDPANQRARGGVVLYATQPGSEGSMGGMLALAPHFQTMLERALDLAANCSNDPLCAEQHVQHGGHNGPACYGCVLAAETSCEHRNLWLDRELLLANLP